MYTKQQVMLLDDILLIPDEAFFSTCESPMRENNNGCHCFGPSACWEWWCSDAWEVASRCCKPLSFSKILHGCNIFSARVFGANESTPYGIYVYPNA